MKEYIEKDAIAADGWHLQRHISGDGYACVESMDILDIPAADVVDGETYRELLKVAREMHRWIFLNTADELAVYDECGLTDEMNELLGY